MNIRDVNERTWTELLADRWGGYRPPLTVHLPVQSVYHGRRQSNGQRPLVFGGGVEIAEFEATPHSARARLATRWTGAVRLTVLFPDREDPVTQSAALVASMAEIRFESRGQGHSRGRRKTIEHQDKGKQQGTRRR